MQLNLNNPAIKRITKEFEKDFKNLDAATSEFVAAPLNDNIFECSLILN